MVFICESPAIFHGFLAWTQEILEHSLADNGLTVLGRVDADDDDGVQSNATALCGARLGRLRHLAAKLPLGLKGKVGMKCDC